jgi:hypothetical protein
MNKGLHVLHCPPRSGKTIFVKCFTHQLQLQGKKVLLIARLGVATLHLLLCALIVYSIFKILVKGHLTTIIEPSSTLKTLKHANLILIDEMFVMTNIVLCTIKYF